jgi:mannose-6-phosphate isomerase-like protein (cupin superfamily)
MSMATAMFAPKKYIGSSARPRSGMLQLLQVERWDVRRDGPLSEATLRRKLDAFRYDAVPRVYQAGVPAAPLADGRERVLAVLTGLIKGTIDGESVILTAGDALFVSRGANCRVVVVGSSPAYCLEAVYRTEPA